MEPQFDKVNNFDGGYAEVKLDPKVGQIDKKGKFKILLDGRRFSSISLFKEGFAAIKTYDNKSGFIDKSGEIVIKPEFDEAIRFSEGLAHVKIGDKWGYINKFGNYVIEPIYETASPFTNGLANVTDNGKVGYIDKKGNIVIEIKFEDASSFKEDKAWVKVGGKYGIIDKTGDFLIEPKYEEISQFNEGLAKVKIKGRYGYKVGMAILMAQVKLKLALNTVMQVDFLKVWRLLN